MCRLLLVVAMALSVCSVAEGVEANPIRRVVTLLQEMQHEVEAQGEKEQELYDKFMCYCETTSADLAKSAEEAKAQIDELSAALEQGKSEKAQLDQELKDHKNDRASAQQDLNKATAIRKKEAAEYEDLKKDSATNIAALGSAIPAIEKGMGSSALMQMPHHERLMQIVEAAPEVSNLDKSRVLAFFEGKSDDYEPQSGQIVGILKTMKEQMESSASEADSEEANAAQAYGELKAAKSDEITVSTSSIETKSTRSGELAVQNVENKGALDDASVELNDSERYSASLKAACEEKTKEWTARRGMRAQEVSAISEAISVLNDDDALDIFKKAVPSAALAQTTGFLQQHKTGFASPSSKVGKLQRAATIVSAAASSYKSAQLGLLSYTMKSYAKQQNDDFGTVTKIIDDMIDVLHEEAASDDKKKEWCTAELADAEKEEAANQDKKSDGEAAISEIKDTIDTLNGDVSALQEEIKKLDASVTLATVNRKKEHSEYTESVTLNEAAVQLIEKAKNRLNKFYQPALYKEEPKKELSAQDRIVANLSFLQTIRKMTVKKVAPPEVPETWGAYKPAGGKSGGVVALMDMLQQDLKSDMAQAKHDEETAQKEYDDLMVESKETRQQNSKSIVDKEANKAQLEGKLEEGKQQDAMNGEQLMNVQQRLGDVHSSCDFLLANFDLRHTAREGEIESLQNAKAVLAGAKFE